jgi:hypothetical protein
VTGAVAGVFAGGIGPYVFSWTYQLLAVGGLLLVAGTAYRHGGRRLLVAAALVYVLLPQLWLPKKIGDADLALTLLLFATVSLLATAALSGKRSYACLAWFTAVLAATVKLEGLPCLAVVAAGLAAATLWQRWHGRCPEAASYRLCPRWLPGCCSLLLLSWYGYAALKRFPSMRFERLSLGVYLGQALQVPRFYWAFARRMVNLSWPPRLTGGVALPADVFYAVDEVLFRGSAYRYLHLPLLAVLFLVLTVKKKVPPREWRVPAGVTLLLCLLYPWFYTVHPGDLDASVDRLILQLTGAMSAMILLWLGRLWNDRGSAGEGQSPGKGGHESDPG